MTSLISGESDKLVHLWKLILLGCKKTIEESQQGRNQENLLRSIDLDKSRPSNGKIHRWMSSQNKWIRLKYQNYWILKDFGCLRQIFAFLSDPGTPGVRSLGPDVRPSVTEYMMFLKLN